MNHLVFLIGCGARRASLGILVLGTALLFSMSCSSTQSRERSSNVEHIQEVGTNRIDRDGDGLIDDDEQNYGEAGTPPPRSAPSDQEICGDGEDNDGDLDVDCDDAECSVLPGCQSDDTADGVEGE